jgi:hypothetical protein
MSGRKNTPTPRTYVALPPADPILRDAAGRQLETLRFEYRYQHEDTPTERATAAAAARMMAWVMLAFAEELAPTRRERRPA